MKKIESKVIGYILLSPALTSVVLFFIKLLVTPNEDDRLTRFLYTSWTGNVLQDVNARHQEFGGSYTSALPFYFGLMAIAGAYLIKDRKL